MKFALKRMDEIKVGMALEQSDGVWIIERLTELKNGNGAFEGYTATIVRKYGPELEETRKRVPLFSYRTYTVLMEG